MMDFNSFNNFNCFICRLFFCLNFLFKFIYIFLLRNKFKAHPLNKKIFEAPPSVSLAKKVTLPEPFDITDSKKVSLRSVCGGVTRRDRLKNE